MGEGCLIACAIFYLNSTFIFFIPYHLSSQERTLRTGAHPGSGSGSYKKGKKKVRTLRTGEHPGSGSGSYKKGKKKARTLRTGEHPWDSGSKKKKGGSKDKKGGDSSSEDYGKTAYDSSYVEPTEIVEGLPPTETSNFNINEPPETEVQIILPQAADEEEGPPDYWFSVTPPKPAPTPEEEVKPEEVPAPEPAPEEEPAKPDYWFSVTPPKAEQEPEAEPTAAPTMMLVSDAPSAVPSATAKEENATARALATGSYDDMGDDYSGGGGGSSKGGKVCAYV
jgi:hypothetical protein